jgi:hypothetical protein
MELRDTLLFFSSQEQRFWSKAVAPANILLYMMYKAIKKISVMEEKEITWWTNHSYAHMKKLRMKNIIDLQNIGHWTHSTHLYLR